LSLSAGWIAALALGLSIGLAVTAAALQLSALFDGGLRPVAAGLLLALAIGLAAPGKLALWIVGRARRTAAGGDPAGISLRDDRPLQAGVMAAASLLGGLSAAALPIACGWAAAAQAYMHERFLWNVPSEVVLQVVLGLLVGLVPIGLLGMALVPVQAWSPRACERDPGVALIGGGVGALLAWLIGARLGRPEAAMLAAALPPLVLALGVMWRLPPAAPAEVAVVDRDHSSHLPSHSDRHPRVLRASMVGVGACAAWALAGWIASAGTEQRLTAVAAGMVLTGVGWCLAGVRAPERERGIASFGIRCALAGSIVAVAVLVDGRADPASAWAGSAFFGLGLAMVGFACASGQALALHRVSVRPSMWGRLYARLVVGGLLAAGVGVPISRAMIGAPATSAAGALALLSIGGALIIHDPHQAPGVRRRRLFWVFGVVGLMLLLAPL
jgi:hypothetical protein